VRKNEEATEEGKGAGTHCQEASADFRLAITVDSLILPVNFVDLEPNPIQSQTIL
jgi:hypothetical protein